MEKKGTTWYLLLLVLGYVLANKPQPFGVIQTTDIMVSKQGVLIRVNTQADPQAVEKTLEALAYTLLGVESANQWPEFVELMMDVSKRLIEGCGG